MNIKTNGNLTHEKPKIYIFGNLQKFLKNSNAKLNMISLCDDDFYIDRETIIYFICSCGVEGHKNFRSIRLKGAFCKDCIIKNQLNKAKITYLKKYGVENPFQNSIIKEKIRQIRLSNYGTEKEDTRRIRFNTTCLKRYGTKYPIQNREIHNRTGELKNFNCEEYKFYNTAKILHEIRTKK